MNPNPSHQKRRVERGAPSESVNQTSRNLLPLPLKADPQAQWSPAESVEELTTPLLTARWGPTSALVL